MAKTTMFDHIPKLPHSIKNVHAFFAEREHADKALAGLTRAEQEAVLVDVSPKSPEL